MSDELTGRGEVDTRDDVQTRGEVATDAQQPEDGAAAARTSRRPSPGPTPGAAAASRARRIGGSARRPVQPAPPASPEHPDRTRGESPAGAKRAARRGRDGETSSAASSTSAAAPTVSMTKPGGAPSTAAPGTRPEAAAPAPAAASAPRWLRWLPAFVLTAAALAMAAFFAVESHGVWWARPSDNAVRDQVLAAAKNCVVAANSYSYKDFAAAEQKGAACTTGRQTDIYRKAMADLKPKADKLKATQVAQVNAAGVSQISQDGKQWTVLVFGQLTVHATQTGPKGRIDPFGAVVRMDHVGSKWLLSQIVPISSPTH